MAITRHNKVLYTRKKLKTSKKYNEDKREQRQQNKNYEELDYQTSLCKKSRFKPFCG